MSKYKLSKSGIERLERFKRDIESGNVIVRARFRHDEFLYNVVENSEMVTCCASEDQELAKKEAVAQIEKTLNGKIETDKDGYFVKGGLCLLLSEVEVANA